MMNVELKIAVCRLDIAKVVATQRFFIFTPKIGEDSQFDSYFSKGVGSTTQLVVQNAVSFF